MVRGGRGARDENGDEDGDRDGDACQSTALPLSVNVGTLKV